MILKSLLHEAVVPEKKRNFTSYFLAKIANRNQRMSNSSQLHERTPLYYEKPSPPLRKLSQLYIVRNYLNNENSKPIILQENQCC
jgi:hypothetical protein